MRISDWSSDVCSSDLQQRIVSSLTQPADAAIKVGRLAQWRGGLHSDDKVHNLSMRLDRIERLKPGRFRGRRIHRYTGRTPDRKTVVKGQSVSVRVDLGDVCSIKKKKTKQVQLI